MPLQVKRLLLAFALFIGLMLAMKYFLTPKSWGEFGHYRGLALKEIADKEPKYLGSKSCVSCHDTIATLQMDGEHKSINCETCHGPGYKHNKEPEKNKLGKLLGKTGGREFCVKCHAINAARPKNIIKQIDIVEHNQEEACINCHNPHKPWE